jgi:hypothetical protein
MSSPVVLRGRCRGEVDAVEANPLPYGQVRVEAGEIAIGFESVVHVSASVRELFERAVATAGVDPENVLVVRVSEARVEVDVIDDRDISWPARTVRVAAAAARHRAAR